MSPKDLIRGGLDTSAMIVDAYIGDLDDADLLIRAVPGMNHIAWQIGHLIASERKFVELVAPGLSPDLPEGFEEAHGPQSSGSDDASRFLPRTRYQELWKAQRAATLAALEQVSESDLGKLDPEKFPPYAPTVAALLNLCAMHPIMHAGQFVPVRRLRNKPVTI